MLKIIPLELAEILVLEYDLKSDNRGIAQAKLLYCIKGSDKENHGGTL